MTNSPPWALKIHTIFFGGGGSWYFLGVQKTQILTETPVINLATNEISLKPIKKNFTILTFEGGQLRALGYRFEVVPRIDDQGFINLTKFLPFD